MAFLPQNPLAAALLHRLAQAVPVLLIVAVGTFLLMEAAPGDAVDAYLAKTGGDAGLVAQLRADWGLNRHWTTRLLAYLGGILTGDFGFSVAFNRPVVDVILERAGNTLLLTLGANALAIAIGVPLGIFAGRRPGSPADRAVLGATLLFYALPGFWVGLMLILGFAVKLAWFPLGGVETIASDLTGVARVLDIARHLVLPTCSLALLYLALYARMMRTGMVEVWRAPFIRTAQAKGIASRRLLMRHVVRAALLPVLTLVGLQAGALLGGSVVIESVFAIPGLGRLAFESVTQRDMPLLMGIVLANTLLVILASLAVDIVYRRLDPRIGQAA
ncbi:ABC transporter permease [Lacibacterium aquatile]|uniref:ABC transporter permease n=1 Tax=Lacibacterium aquatile TaxID=1168082 RepID=A0ABW5DVG7_9PROT